MTRTAPQPLSEEAASAEALYRQAVDLCVRREFSESLRRFQALLGSRSGELDLDMRTDAYVHALKCAIRLGLWSDAVVLGRQAEQEAGADARVLQYLGEALVQLERIPEAVEALRGALRLDPEFSAAHSLLSLIATGRLKKSSGRRVRIWPARRKEFQVPRKLIRRYVLAGREPARFVAPDSHLMTLGSCFAENLARQLQTLGYDVWFESIGEEVNSTYANRYLLEWVERGVVSPQTEAMEQAFGPVVRRRLRKGIERSDVFVLTLGAAPCFFDEETGEFLFTAARSTDQAVRHGLMRTTTVAENVDNLREVIGAVRRISRREPTFVVTVSPVPLAGTTEMDSAVVADCVSKSILRVACHEVVAAAGPKVVYWPSFEMVRWLGAHLDHDQPAAYGEDDDNSRHVSRWLVDLIVELFLEEHAVAKPPEQPEPEAVGG